MMITTNTNFVMNSSGWQVIKQNTANTWTVKSHKTGATTVLSTESIEEYIHLQEVKVQPLAKYYL